MKNSTNKIGLKTFVLMSFFFLYSCSIQYDTKLRDKSIQSWEQTETQQENENIAVDDTTEIN